MSRSLHHISQRAVPIPGPHRRGRIAPQLITITYLTSSISLSCMPTSPLTSASSRSLLSSSRALPVAGCTIAASHRIRHKSHSGSPQPAHHLPTSLGEHHFWHRTYPILYPSCQWRRASRQYLVKSMNSLYSGAATYRRSAGMSLPSSGRRQFHRRLKCHPHSHTVDRADGQ